MHLTFKGGPERASAIGSKALQIFCGNPRGWQKTPLDKKFVSQFQADLRQYDIHPLVIHATYLINLAGSNEKNYRLSCNSLITELDRARQLGAQFYVIHMGTHGGAGMVEGRKRVAACLQSAVKAVPDGPEILFENTAGGGNTLGTTFEDVAAVMDEARIERLGLCLDTCHALTAGYDIRTPKGAAEMLDSIDKTIGLKRLRCLHVNDSKGDLGSHLDRHEHIGKGRIGMSGFRAFFSDQRLWKLPAILETPRENIQDEIDNLWRVIKIAVDVGAMKADAVGKKPLAPKKDLPKSFTTGMPRVRQFFRSDLTDRSD